MQSYTQSYIYDAGTNLVALKHQGGSEQRQYQPVREANNRQLTHQYDQVGNQLSQDSLDEMVYNSDGQLAYVTWQNGGYSCKEYYTYSSPGVRVRKVTEVRTLLTGVLVRLETVHYVGDVEFRATYTGTAMTYDGDTVTDYDQVDTRTVTRIKAGHGQVGKITTHNGSDTITYNALNHLDSNELELDENAQLTHYQQYAPYGETVAEEKATEDTSSELGYSGQEEDESGLLYYGYRYYQKNGIWNRADPIKFKSGQLNLYNLVDGNPVTYRDERGLVKMEVFGKDMIERIMAHDKWALDIIRNNWDKVKTKSYSKFAKKFHLGFYNALKHEASMDSDERDENKFIKRVEAAMKFEHALKKASYYQSLSDKQQFINAVRRDDFTPNLDQAQMQYEYSADPDAEYSSIKDGILHRRRTQLEHYDYMHPQKKKNKMPQNVEKPIYESEIEEYYNDDPKHSLSIREDPSLPKFTLGPLSNRKHFSTDVGMDNVSFSKETSRKIVIKRNYGRPYSDNETITLSTERLKNEFREVYRHKVYMAHQNQSLVYQYDEKVIEEISQRTVNYLGSISHDDRGSKESINIKKGYDKRWQKINDGLPQTLNEFIESNPLDDMIDNNRVVYSAAWHHKAPDKSIDTGHTYKYKTQSQSETYHSLIRPTLVNLVQRNEWRYMLSPYTNYELKYVGLEQNQHYDTDAVHQAQLKYISALQPKEVKASEMAMIAFSKNKHDNDHHFKGACVVCGLGVMGVNVPTHMNKNYGKVYTTL